MAGTAPPVDNLDGVSIAAVFDDPTLTSLPTDKGTLNKTLAFSQYPHTSDFNCPFERGGKCYNSSSIDVGSDAGAGADADAEVGTEESGMATTLGRSDKMDYMGYRVRDQQWAYCVWLPWNAESSQWPSPALFDSSAAAGAGAGADATMYLELYDHSTDLGTDFDEMDLVNLAYDPAHAQTVAEKYRAAYQFFHTYMPPAPAPAPGPGPGPKPGPAPGPAKAECTAAGGILDHDGVACCAKSCTACGGKGCASLPGGKTNCCRNEVEGNGKDCKSA